MKKFLLMLVAGMMLAVSAVAVSYDDAQLPPPTTDVDIPILGGGGNGNGNGNGDGDGGDNGGHPVPTSVEDEVEARYLGSISQLEVEFNEPVGRVEVVLVDLMSGRTLLAYECNSEMESLVALPITLYAGSYKLTICGPDYEGYGLFGL